MKRVTINWGPLLLLMVAAEVNTSQSKEKIWKVGQFFVILVSFCVGSTYIFGRLEAADTWELYGFPLNVSISDLLLSARYVSTWPAGCCCYKKQFEQQYPDNTTGTDCIELIFPPKNSLANAPRHDVDFVFIRASLIT